MNAGAGNDVIDDAIGDRNQRNGGNDTFDGGTGNDVLYGGTGNDVLYGWTGNDGLFGEDGNDLLSGEQNNDSMRGGNGDDLLHGSAGKDTMGGDAGNDIFDFDVTYESAVGNNRDIILSFDFGASSTTGDKVDLSTMDANLILSGNQSFSYIDTAPFSAAGQVRVYDRSGQTIIALNTDGDLSAESEIEVRDGAYAASYWDGVDFIL